MKNSLGQCPSVNELRNATANLGNGATQRVDTLIALAHEQGRKEALGHQPPRPIDCPFRGRGIILLSAWAKQVGVSALTVYRWREAGWLQVVNIASRPYVTSEAIEQFIKRAEAGEFAQQHHWTR